MDTAIASSTSLRRVQPLPGPAEFSTLDTGSLRSRLVLDDLFSPDELRLVVTNLDRLVVGGAMPSGPLQLPAHRELGTRYFTERRELGVINLGDPGIVRVGAGSFELGRLDALYIGLGEPGVVFEPAGAGQPQFYLLSCPAHRKYETRRITRAEANVVEVGDERHASRRRIVQYICPARAASCQLVMGFTELEPGSVWNTMPAHTHSRRSEIYLYFDLADGMVVHLAGEPRNTRHVIVHDREAVLSPWWSIHSGAGTRAYRFVWGMAGENQDFADVDPIPVSELR